MLIAARITPADAGKTLAEWFAICGVADHPRGCGENRKNEEVIKNE